MPAKYEWTRDTYAGWICQIGNVSLCASPRLTSTRKGKLVAAANTSWQAQCSEWDAPSRTLSRYGRDAWKDRPTNAIEAKRLAESIYEEERFLSFAD
jgi:hypothetical protein